MRLFSGGGGGGFANIYNSLGSEGQMYCRVQCPFRKLEKEVAVRNSFLQEDFRQVSMLLERSSPILRQRETFLRYHGCFLNAVVSK